MKYSERSGDDAPRRPSHVLQFAGLLAWAVVSWSLWQTLADSSWRPLGVLLALLFVPGFMISSRLPPFEARSRALGIGGLCLQAVSAIGLLPLDHNGLVSILAIITVSQLPWVWSMRVALSLLAAYLLIHYGIADLVWQARQPLQWTMIYGSFMLFALFATSNAVREQRGREQLALRNSELKATQHLLGDSARQGERLRIARDLHDTLGHHLSALSIQLEIAAHLSNGDAHRQIEKSRHLAKLLLADVRATVSDLREDDGIDLQGALRDLIAEVPRLRVTLAIADGFRIDDAARAQALLRAAQELLTNTLRHAAATLMHIDLRRVDTEIRLSAHDDGRGAPHLVEGNGLRGLRERIGALGGQVQIEGAAGFAVHIAVPEHAA